MKTFFVDGMSQPLCLNIISILQFTSPFRPLLSTRVVYPWGESLPFPVRKPTLINIYLILESSKHSKKNNVFLPKIFFSQKVSLYLILLITI